MSSVPKAMNLLEIVYCREILTAKRFGFKYERAPERVFLLTERELILISEEVIQSRFWRKREKYGIVITYLPVTRVARYRFERNTEVGNLSIELCSAKACETILLSVPLEKENEVSALLEDVLANSQCLS